MPHCRIEYTPNIGMTTPELVSLAHGVMLDCCLFGVSDVKTRASQVTDFILGSGTLGEGAFIHITIALLSGRTIEQKSGLTRAMAQAIRAQLPTLDSITVDIVDMARETYAKDVYSGLVSTHKLQ